MTPARAGRQTRHAASAATATLDPSADRSVTLLLNTHTIKALRTRRVGIGQNRLRSGSRRGRNRSPARGRSQVGRVFEIVRDVRVGQAQETAREPRGRQFHTRYGGREGNGRDGGG